MRLKIMMMMAFVAILPGFGYAQSVESPRISLEQAIEKGLQNSPIMSFAKGRAGAAKGVLEQSKAYPNPQAMFETENVGGTDQFGGFDSAETTFGIAQTIEIGGKRSARSSAARQGYTASQLELSATQQDLIRNIKLAYFQTVSAAEKLKLTEEQVYLANEVLDAVAKRVEAAREPEFQRSKAQVSFSTSLLQRDRAKREYETTKQQLSSLWGDTSTNFKVIPDAFFVLKTPKNEGGYEVQLQNTPDALMWEALTKKAQSEVDFERARAIPDPNFSLSVRDFREEDAQAFVFGVSLPIPVLNTNRGNIMKARQELVQVESNQRLFEIQQRQTLFDALNSWRVAYGEASTLRDEILPQAQQAFDLTREGYDLGKFTYLEVLDAQRTLFDVRDQYRQALMQIHTENLTVDRLTATNDHTERKNNYAD